MRRHCHIIQREASALLFLLQWAMREPLSAGRVTIQAFTLLFINQSVQSGRPTGHGNIIMKEDKNEELQSRRSFFKNAAKAALPIIGAIALAHMPVAAKANSTAATGCVDGCYSACLTGCVTACKGGCGAHCRDNCYSNCNTSCSAICRSGSNNY
jgi:CXXX repeat radical SAM target protein